MTTKVSIGMPVYNGESFLAGAIESILAQTFGDFEMLVSDNASTDATADICADFARRDRRINYVRQPDNLGAAPNYNYVFHNSSAPFFKWAAHDDLLAPSFLEACLAQLVADPGAAVAFTQMREIDVNGEFISDYNAPIIWDRRSPSSRLESLLCTPPDRTYIRRCVPVTGLMRRSALERTRLIGRFPHADKVTIVELALEGDLLEVPEHLFLRRSHSGTSLAANPSPSDLRRWFDPKARGRIVTPRSRLFIEYVRAVQRASLGAAEKAACARVVARMLCRDWRLFGGEIRRAILSEETGR